jgi:hypothetical protein
MQRREIILTTVVAGLIGLVAAGYGHRWYRGLFAARQSRVDALQKEIADKELKIARGQRAAAHLAQWEHRSLPANRELARSLYQSWLRAIVDRVKLTAADVTSQIVPSRRDAFDRLSFTINGRGSLEQLTRLLYEFYGANHLHQIRSLKVKPLADAKQLELQIVVEALVLPGADRQDDLNREPARQLALGDLAKYQAVIVSRNLFSQYLPPKPPIVEDRPTPPEFDIAKFAVITGIFEVGQRPQMWLNVRTTGKTLKLFEGDRFEVGTLSGTVIRIGSRRVELSAGGKRLLVALGESLRDAAELPSGDL